MLEELKIIIPMLTNVAEIGGWTVGGFILYKILIIMVPAFLTYYGVKELIIRVSGVLSTLINKKKIVVEEVRQVNQVLELEGLKGICIRCDDTYEDLLTQLRRLTRYDFHSNSLTKEDPGPYIHEPYVNWLKAAIDEKVEREAQLKKK